MNALESFATYLETAGPGDAARGMRRRVGEAAVESARARWSGRLLGPESTPESVTAALGPPDVRDDLTIGYAMPTRPRYLYTFRFDAPGRRLLASGFRRIEAVANPLDDVSDPVQVPQRLAELGATADEVRSWLGAPAREYGWWPVETWEYSDGPILQLRHGVVEQID